MRGRDWAGTVLVAALGALSAVVGGAAVAMLSLIAGVAAAVIVVDVARDHGWRLRSPRLPRLPLGRGGRRAAGPIQGPGVGPGGAWPGGVHGMPPGVFPMAGPGIPHGSRRVQFLAAGPSATNVVYTGVATQELELLSPRVGSWGGSWVIQREQLPKPLPLDLGALRFTAFTSSAITFEEVGTRPRRIVVVRVSPAPSRWRRPWGHGMRRDQRPC